MSEPTNRRPVAIDLYAGAGGLSLGMEQAGFDVVAAAELDPIHVLTHRFNMSRTPVLCRDLGAGPVSEVSDAILEISQVGLAAHDRVGEDLDIAAVVGGPPCQGFSVGGVRNSDDDRNSQLLTFVDLVVQLQPKVFCLENVAGLLEPRFDSLRREALRRLVSDGGYNVSGLDRVVNASGYGVPQSRRRVLVMGSRVGDAPTLEEPQSGRVTVGEALQGLPDPGRYRRLLFTDEVPISDEDLTKLLSVESLYARRLLGLEIDDRDKSAPRPYDPRILTSSLRTVHTRKTVQRFARTAQGSAETVSRLFRLDLENLARTLRAGSGSDRGSHTSPRPIHPVKNRVITVREAARLHGYPDWFRFHATNWHGHRQVGNSVPPPLAAAAGRALIAALGAETSPRHVLPIPLGDTSWLSLAGVGARSIVDDLMVQPRTSPSGTHQHH